MLMTDDTQPTSKIAGGVQKTGPDSVQAPDTAKGLVNTAKETASQAWGTARSYAKNASHKADEKLGPLKAIAADKQALLARRIGDEPIKAVAIGAAAGALLAALVLRRGRGTRRF